MILLTSLLLLLFQVSKFSHLKNPPKLCEEKGGLGITREKMLLLKALSPPCHLHAKQLLLKNPVILILEEKPLHATMLLVSTALGGHSAQGMCL